MEWAKDLVERKAWVFHTLTYAVGQASCFYERGEFVSRVNGEPVNAPVLELSTGHSFIADEKRVLELSKAEIRYFEAMQEGFNGLIVVAAKNARENGVELEKGLAMLIAILRAQLAALESGE